MPPTKLPPRPVMVLIIGLGTVAGVYIAGNPWQMSAVAGIAAAALSWVAFRRISSGL